MRWILIDGVFRADLMIECAIINLIYGSAGSRPDPRSVEQGPRFSRPSRTPGQALL
jgi:hypothetical protein